MRIFAPLLLVLTLAADAAAQSHDISRADLPSGVGSRLQRIIDAPETHRFDGPHIIAADEVVEGDVAVFGGLLTIAGRVNGQVIVVDGDVFLQPGAAVSGDVTTIAGAIRGIEVASLGGAATEYGEGFDLFDRPRRDRYADRHWPADFSHGFGSSELTFRVDQSYNRVEGLPIEFGPDIRTGGSNPTRLQAFGIWRTAAGPVTNTQRMGYVARLEQFFGGRRAFRLGVSARSEVEPIESWSLSDLEASLSAFLLHRDQRDYFEREGWSAYARFAPRGLPVDATVEYSDERHATLGVRDPWTLFNGDDSWREQPLIADGDLRRVTGTLELDLRHGRDYARTGLLLRGTIDHGLGGDLMLADASPAGAFVAGQPVSTDFTAGLVDLRGYGRVGRDGTLSVRGVAGGSIDRSPLPPQFQHALGGAGSLPGYDAFGADCGARSSLVLRSGEDGAGQPFFSSYGCDRFALFQAEFRGGLGFGFGHSDDDDDWDWHFDADPDWIVFFDAGRGWAYDGAGAQRADTGTLMDAGAGIVLGDIGIYGAVPVRGQERSLKLFVRVGPRF